MLLETKNPYFMRLQLLHPYLDKIKIIDNMFQLNVLYEIVSLHMHLFPGTWNTFMVIEQAQTKCERTLKKSNDSKLKQEVRKLLDFLYLEDYYAGGPKKPRM